MNKKSFHTLSFMVHSWMGLWFSLLMTFLSITGTLAIFSLEMDWLVHPEMRAAERVDADNVAWGAAFDSLREQYPEYTFYSISRLSENYFNLLAGGRTPWDENVRVWLQPHNGELAGITRWYSIQRFFRELHRNLFMRTSIGVPIVSFLSLPLLISTVAGFIVYRKFWKGFFRKPRWGRNGRILSGDLHRLIGLWTSWFIALIALTSLFYLVESGGYYGWQPWDRFASPPQISDPLEREEIYPANFSGRDIDLAIATAKAELPGLEVAGVGLLANNSNWLQINGKLSAVLVRQRANVVYIDPSDGSVLGSARGEDLSVMGRISEAADPLHFGYFGGLLTRIIWFVLGVGMVAMSITGVIIYAKRLIIREKRTDSRTKILSQEEQPVTNN